MRLFNIDHFFNYKEIYPSRKIKHLQKIHQDSGIMFNDMVFFDDEYRNIKDATSIGVDAVFVSNGINKKMVYKWL